MIILSDEALNKRIRHGKMLVFALLRAYCTFSQTSSISCLRTESPAVAKIDAFEDGRK